MRSPIRSPAQGPELTTTAGAAKTVSLANNNLLQGVVVSNGPGGFAAAGTGIAGLPISDSSLGGLSLTNATGTATVTNTTLTHLAISGGSINFTGNNADITTSPNVAVSVPRAAIPARRASTRCPRSLPPLGTGLQFDNADGVYTFNGTTTLNGGDAGIDILNGSAGSFTFGPGTSITSPSGAAFNLANSTAAVTYSGTITQNNAASAVVATNNTGGSMTFGGLVVANTGTANAVSLTGNAGATISFTGGLAITTTSGAGLHRHRRRHDSVAGAGNTIATTTGTALNLNGVTVGAGGLNFASVVSQRRGQRHHADERVILRRRGNRTRHGQLAERHLARRRRLRHARRGALLRRPRHLAEQQRGGGLRSQRRNDQRGDHRQRFRRHQ